MGRLFRMAYTQRGRKDRELFPYQLRDGEAGLRLVSTLEKKGFTYVRPLINYPSKGPELKPYDLGIFRSDDLILLCTRPPMDDHRWPSRYMIPRSFTVLEETLFEGPLRRWLHQCSRTVVQLSDEAASISSEIDACKSLEFHQHGGAAISGCNGVRVKPGPTQRSAVFLIYTEAAWPGGPAFLASFGMGGVDTLVWAYHLSTRFSDMLCTTPFALAEITYGP